NALLQSASGTGDIRLPFVSGAGASYRLKISGASVTYTLKISNTPLLVVTNTNDSGFGSLRQAIINANATAGLDTITFLIGSGAKSIHLSSLLPTITDPVIIDGTTQPGYAGSPLIELEGSGVGSSGDGLAIYAGGSTVRGLAINRFPSSGISLFQRGGNR